MRRSNRKRDYWKEHYTAYKQSGLTQRDYCRKHQLGYWSFNHWKRTFEKAENNTDLQEIPLQVSPGSITENRITIKYQGIEITVPDTVSPVILNGLFSALKGLS